MGCHRVVPPVQISDLAKELLLDDWIGDEAFNLCKSIYELIFEATNTAYSELLEDGGEGLIGNFIHQYTRASMNCIELN